MARPKVKQKRDYQLNFSLTQNELETLENRAEAAGMHLVDYGRQQLLNRRTASAATTGDPDTIEAYVLAVRTARLLRHELRRIGNNLNQIARRLNGRDEPPPSTLEPLLQELRNLLFPAARP